MSGTDQYMTIEGPAKGEFKEKGSKFLAFAYPVSSEEEIQGFLAELRRSFHDASHHCYAWRLGAEMDRYRVNDDGEPSGSAGNPIFGQIQSRNLTNVLVAVVRYFGGTLLGVGGLIRAYRESASEALGNAREVRKRVETEVRVRFGYEQMNSVMTVVKELGIGTKDQDFDMVCTMTLLVWDRLLDQAMKRLDLIEDCHVEIITST